MPTRSGRHLSTGKNGGCSRGRLAWQYPGRGRTEGQGNHLQQQIPRWTCFLLPPLCCLYLVNPALLQPFSLLKSSLSYTRVQAGGKPKGGVYLPARQLPGAGMLSAPTSYLLHLHPFLCLHISDSGGWEHISMGFVGGGAPGRTWWGHTSWPALSKTVFISAPAASASFLPVLLHFRHAARLSVPSAGRGVKVVHDKDKTAPLLLPFVDKSLPAPLCPITVSSGVPQHHKLPQRFPIPFTLTRH